MMGVSRAQWAQEVLRSLLDDTGQWVREGGLPFGAMVVSRAGRVLGHGYNCVEAHNDPTAHAEVTALRRAAASEGTPALKGSALIATAEPCALCYMVSWTAGIEEVLFAVDRDTAAMRGFEYRASYAFLDMERMHEALRIHHARHLMAEALSLTFPAGPDAGTKMGSAALPVGPAAGV